MTELIYLSPKKVVEADAKVNLLLDIHDIEVESEDLGSAGSYNLSSGDESDDEMDSD